jgi:hypothetical protein
VVSLYNGSIEIEKTKYDIRVSRKTQHTLVALSSYNFVNITKNYIDIKHNKMNNN